MTSLSALLLALLLDRLGGEYPNALHPVVWMGNVVKAAERVAIRRGPVAQLLWGALMAVAIPTCFAVAAWGVARLPWVGFPLTVLLLKATFSIGELGRASSRVARALQADDLPRARYHLRSLCSRDASDLSSSEVAAGAIESVAENASDSLVAPLLWFAVFGLPGAVFYRAANTLDSMIGYHGKYEYLGKASARLDDALNLAPARLTALLLLAVGAAHGHDARVGWRVMRRDARLTESPNAGWPMAAMAGLLGVRLEKPGHYALGSEGAPPSAARIGDAWSVVGDAIGLCIAITVCAAAWRAS